MEPASIFPTRLAKPCSIPTRHSGMFTCSAKTSWASPAVRGSRNVALLVCHVEERNWATGSD